MVRRAGIDRRPRARSQGRRPDTRRSRGRRHARRCAACASISRRANFCWCSTTASISSRPAPILAKPSCRAAPHVRLLASSREPLNVAGEQTYSLPPLALPDTGSGAEITARSEAVQLFVERARLRQPGFSRDRRRMRRQIAQLCARLDGIPLALELAAARVGRAAPSRKSPSGCTTEFRLLTGGSRTALPRQQTLRALIDWSYDLLGDAEKIVVRKTLGVRRRLHARGRRERRRGSGHRGEEVLDLLTGLVHKSLVMPRSTR